MDFHFPLGENALHLKHNHHLEAFQNTVHFTEAYQITVTICQEGIATLWLVFQFAALKINLYNNLSLIYFISKTIQNK